MGLFTRYVNDYKNIFTIFTQYKNEWKEYIIFKNKKIDKTNFYKYKKLFKIDDTNTNKILVSKREPYDHSLQKHMVKKLKALIIDLIVNINPDYHKTSVHNLFTANIQVDVL